MYGILLSPLDWYPLLLLGTVSQATKMNMRDCQSFLAAPVEPLAHRRNVASLGLCYRYYFGRCSSELPQQVPLPFSPIFQNYLPIECFSLIYHPSGLNSRINRHLLTVGSFYALTVGYLFFVFPICFSLFVLLFLETPCLAVAVQPCME